jgi:hypothetical protein
LSRFKHPRNFVIVPRSARRTARPTTSGPRLSPPTGSADDLRRFGGTSRTKRDGLGRPQRAAPTSPELLLLRLAAALDLREHVVGVEDEHVVTVEGDLVPPYFE